MGDWQTQTSHVAYENPWMLVREDNAVNPAGKETMYGYVESKSDAVYVVAVDDDQNTYLVQQYRYPLKQVLWECVAGRMDGQSPEVAAKRELLEETGIQAERVTLLGQIFAATGISTFKVFVCLATGLTKISDTLDADDGILAVQKVSLSNISDKIADGTLQCSQSISSFFMAKNYLEKELLNV